MRQFSILLVFALAFGGAAVLYEHESRKVKGVLTQITELQAQMGDLQAEVNRLNSELEAAKLAERRRPGLKTIARHLRRDSGTSERAPTSVGSQAVAQGGQSRQLVASDVTSAPPAINREGSAEDAEWNRPTMDAETYRSEPGDQQGGSGVVDPYQ